MQGAKAIFVANIKGGVGKSTLTVYLTEYLRQRFKRQPVILLDTDPQGTSFELMEPRSKNGDARFLPVGDRYDGVNMTTLDGVLRRMLSQNETIAMVDTGAGRMDNFWRLALLCNTLLVPTSMSWADLRPTLDGVLRRMLSQNEAIAMVDTGAGKMDNFWRLASLCNTLLVPTSMSWADLRPTLDFINEIDQRKADLQSVTPHVIVVPNRVSPLQRNFQQITDVIKDVNAILAPPISELSIARAGKQSFTGLNGIKGTRFHTEIERLGEFLIEYVFSGELDRIYADASKPGQNVTL